jgi:hypothetical protein
VEVGVLQRTTQKTIFLLSGTLWKRRGLTAVQAVEATMNGLIYLIGLIVVIMFILSFLGLR